MFSSFFGKLIFQDLLKTITNLHYALDLGVLHRARVEASALVLLLGYDLGQLEHPPLSLLLVLAHREVQVETGAACRRLVLEAVFGERKELSEVDLQTLAASERLLGQHGRRLGLVVCVYMH